MGELGQGTFGTVYLAKNRTTGQEVALKKPFLHAEALGSDPEGLPFSAVREIRILKRIQHANIVRLCDVYIWHGEVYIALELLHCDLHAVVANKGVTLQPAHIKALVRDVLTGVAYLHGRGVLHRDLSPGNVLLSRTGVAKLGDFGFARSQSDMRRRWTPQVVTLWYRAPELLMGAAAYTGAIDVWAVGCIFAEMWLREPYMAALATAARMPNELDQLSAIFAARGSPTAETWPGFENLPAPVVAFPRAAPTLLEMREVFSAVPDDAIDLIDQMLRLDPNRRLTAEQALRHRYFSEHPPPAGTMDLEDLIKRFDDAKKVKNADLL